MRHAPVLDRRVAARMCRHHKGCGLRITIKGGVAYLRFQRPVDVREEVKVMRQAAAYGPYRVYNPGHTADLRVPA